jgi:hypothetical protein
MKKLYQKTIISISILLIVSLMMPPFSANTPTASATPATIFKIQSGLVTNDSLTTGNFFDWTNNGSAADPAINAPHSHSENSTGYHIGIRAPSAGLWAGWFAITPLTTAKLFHAKIKVPDAKPITGVLDTAVYVQQEMVQDPRIDAMGCGADTFPNNTHWTVSLQAGDKDHEIVYQLLYADDSPNQPTTRDCTLVTNGSNQLTAYIDGQKVFSSNKMNLNMPEPFQYYLELQANSNTPSTGSMFTGSFTDYYATTSDNVKVRNAGAGSIVRIVNATSGNTLASSTADSNGTALVDVGRYHMPINANVQVFDTTGVNLLSSTPSSPGIYGGDVYDVGTSTVPTTVITVNAVDMSGVQSSPSMFTTISNGTTESDGFTPMVFNGFQDRPYSVSVANFDPLVFDHWEDGSRISGRVLTPTTSTVNLTAYFRNTTSPDPPVSLTSTTQYTTNIVTPTILGTATPGYSVQLFDGPTPIASPVTVPSNGTWSITTPSLSEGNHMLSAIAKNGSYTSPPSTSLAMTIDTSTPSISTTGDTQSNSQVNLTGTSLDNSSGIKIVEVSVDNSANFTKVRTNAPTDWSTWSFTTGQLSEGTHHFIARATDMAGNQNTTAVDVQVPPPTINPASPISGPVGQTVSVNFNHLFANTAYRILFGSTAASGSFATGITNSTGGGAGSVTIPSISAGSYVLSATDGTNTPTTPFTVTTPTINPASPTSGQVGQSVSVNFNHLFANTAYRILFGSTAASGSFATGITNSTGGGAGSVTIPSISSGSQVLSVTDGKNTPTTPFTVTKKPTTTLSESNPNPSAVGQVVTFKANVTSTGNPTGIVTFLNGSQILGTNTTSNGIATFSTSVLSKGSHNISSQYSGDSNFAPSTSLVLIQKVAPLCISPNSGDWIILQSCILGSNVLIHGNVIIQNNAVLTIPNGIRLNIDFTHFHLLVKSGGGVLIKSGGSIN